MIPVSSNLARKSQNLKEFAHHPQEWKLWIWCPSPSRVGATLSDLVFTTQED